MIKLCSFALLLCIALSVFDITHYGAIPNTDTLSAQFHNANSILTTILAANSTTTQQRIIRIPSHKFYSMPIRLHHLHNITILIYGKLIASQQITKWPRLPQMQKFYQDFLSFRHCTNITITGGGTINGRGYPWWIVLFHNNQKILPDQNGRPMLVHLINCNYTKIHDLILKNSPQFHLKYDQCHHNSAFNLAIKVNTTAQLRLIQIFSLKAYYPIMFPFNTDGIDPSGTNFHIYNISCQNFDDVVVPKPLDQNGPIGCTRDMIIQNITVKFGIGMAIGSLSPSAGNDCIKNITARNWRMIRPIKSIYVKSNPGHQGTGIFQSLHFQNFTMDRPIWWCIYIGPQQMKQPDGDGPGCMFYPFGKGICPTQPRVTMRNITLKNIRIHNSLFFPVTIRCNATNPCTDVRFQNVRTDKWKIGRKETGNVCQFVIGKGKGNVPKIECLEEEKEDEEVGIQKIEQLEEKKETELFQWMFEESLDAYKVSRMIYEEIRDAVKEIGYQEEDDQVDYHIDPRTLYRQVVQE